jgi:hypothetical protein
MTATAYLVTVGGFLLIEGWPRSGAFGFAVVTATWIGIGIQQNYDLHRRRNDQSG